VNAYCYNQDGKYAEKYDGMNQNCNPTSAHVAKLNNPKPCWKLEQQTRRQEYEQSHCHNNWSPISTHFPLLFTLHFSVSGYASVFLLE